MLQHLNATRKGLITGLLMIGLSLLFYYTGQPVDSPFQYLIYIIYAAGIVWTLYDFSRSAENKNKFAAFFLEGFKCFIVITLLMVVFTFVFNKLHPEFKDQMAEAYKTELVKKGNSTEAEMLTNVEKMKSYYLTMLISGAVFGYLLIGAIIAASTSLLFLRRK